MNEKGCDMTIKDSAGTPARQPWQRPELVRLGTIRDIAQPGGDVNQGASGKGVAIAS